LGIGLALRPGEAVYLPMPPEGSPAPVLEALRPIFEDETIALVSANAKHDQILLARHGIAYRGLAGDAVVASYLLNPGRRSHTLEDLATSFLETKINRLSLPAAASRQ